LASPRKKIDKDSTDGISRFGGVFREPSYTNAYFKAAKVLLEKAKDNGELDELGLPIFYLIRHTVELKIKSLLTIIYDICDMSRELYPEKYTDEIKPSKRQIDRLNTSHNIEKLYNDLKNCCEELEMVFLPNSLLPVLTIIKTYEINPTWSRYNRSGEGHHTKDEVTLPIIRLFDDLEKLFQELHYDNDDSLESKLYSEYQALMVRGDEKNY